MKVSPRQIRYSLQLLIQLHQRKAATSQDGYAMLVTTILAILMFSMIGVYLFSANLYKSVANAVVDSGTTFYAAESGMNQRANVIRSAFAGYSRPQGVEPTGINVAAQMQKCIDNVGAADNAATVGTGDMRCRDTTFAYRESSWKAVNSGISETNAINPNIQYRSYSFLRNLTGNNPIIRQVPAGEAFAGLNMQEYKYRVYATAAKETTGYMPVSAQALLQMDFNSRLIPLFQFAAFYEGDLEITSSSNMTLNGPIHSNTNVWYAPGGVLTIGGQTTSAGNIYKSRSVTSGHGWTTPVGRILRITGGGPDIDVSGAWGAGNILMSATNISNSNGLLKPLAPRLDIPSPSFLGVSGDYYAKADIRVEFDPNNAAQPFGVQSIQGSNTNTFTAAMIRSLRQPVMLVTQAHQGDNKATEWNNLCSNAFNQRSTLTSATTNSTSTDFNNNSAPASLSSLTATDATIASDALRRAIAKSTGTPYTLAQFNGSMMNSAGLATLRGLFQTELGTSLSAAKITTLLGSVTPRDIANKAGNCFLPPPMRVMTGQTDRQEGTSMTILQSNIHSLTIWNRDGQYSNDGVNVLSAAGTVFARKSDIDAVIAAGGSVTNIVPGSYQWMGLAASDTSEDGLVWHSSIKSTYASANSSNSPYGFAFSGGRWLPGPLTLATDQPAYVQGDFNNPGGVQPSAAGDTTVFSGTGSAGAGITRAQNLLQKYPAAVMADTITVLSNSCVGSEGELNCFNVPTGNNLPTTTPTSINAGFLANTFTGSGLNNYMRMMEDWGYTSAGAGSIFRYRGSFISLGLPQRFTGGYKFGCLPAVASNACYYNVPIRDYGFDTTFNTVQGLPPLSPRVVYLKQKVFKRDYDSNRS